MTLFYLETSAMLKRYRPEVGSAFIQELLTRKRTGEELLTSHFTILEVTGVASRMLRGRLLDVSQYERIVIGLLQDISDYGIAVLPVDEDIVSDALRFYPEYSLRGSDAVHFASAVRVNQQLVGEPCYMVTADHELGDACQRYGLGLLNPESPTALAQLASIRG